MVVMRVERWLRACLLTGMEVEGMMCEKAEYGRN